MLKYKSHKIQRLGAGKLVAAGLRVGCMLVHHGKQCLFLVEKAGSAKLFSAVGTTFIYCFLH